MLVLPGASLEAARLRAEDMRQRITDLNMLSQGKHLNKITLSVGVACFPAHGTGLPELLSAVDAALYQAKKNGHNQVVVADSRSLTDRLSHPVVPA